MLVTLGGLFSADRRFGEIPDRLFVRNSKRLQLKLTTVGVHLIAHWSGDNAGNVEFYKGKRWALSLTRGLLSIYSQPVAIP